MFIKKELNLKEAKRVIEDGGVVFTTKKDRAVGKTNAIKAYASWSEKPIIVTARGHEFLYRGSLPLTTIHVDSLERYEFGRPIEELDFLVDDMKYCDYNSIMEKWSHIKLSGFVYLEEGECKNE